MHYSAALLILLCFVPVGSFGQDAPPLDSLLSAALRPTRELVQSGDNEALELVVTNLSSQNVIAFSLEVSTLSTGRAPISGIYTEDFVPSFAGERMSPLITNKYQHFGPLKPGQSYFKPFGARGSNDVTIIVVKTIVFEDNTSVGDQKLARTIFEWHEGAAAELEVVLSSLKAASGSQVRTRLAALRVQLKPPLLEGSARRGKALAVAGGDASSHQTSGRKLARTIAAQKVEEALLADGDEAILMRRAEAVISDLTVAWQAYRSHSHMVEVNQ